MKTGNSQNSGQWYYRHQQNRTPFIGTKACGVSHPSQRLFECRKRTLDPRRRIMYSNQETKQFSDYTSLPYQRNITDWVGHSKTRSQHLPNATDPCYLASSRNFTRNIFSIWCIQSSLLMWFGLCWKYKTDYPNQNIGTQTPPPRRQNRIKFQYQNTHFKKTI